MDAKGLKKYLLDDLNRVKKVLESVGCHSIWETGNEIRCSPPDSNNNTAISVNIETLFCRHYRKDETFRGDILGLIQELRNESFSDSFRYIKSLFGLTSKYVKEDRKDPLSIFKSIRKAHKKITSLDEIDVPKFGMEALNEFIIMPHISLFYEGIDTETQRLFKIGYSPRDDRIIFPHFNYDDKNAIVGITGRTLRSKEEMEQLTIPKYLNYIKGYKKSYSLYGFSHSIDNIKNSKKLFIFEGEKSVLKQWTMTRNKGYSCSVGSHDLSDVQLQIILRYTPVETEIIIGFDKDVMENEDYLIQTAKRFSNYRKVSYIFDSENLLDEKDSPVDKGYHIFCKLVDSRKIIE